MGAGRPPARELSPAEVLRLQRTVGNARVGRILAALRPTGERGASAVTSVAPGMVQRKVGFEFELGIPVRSHGGARVKNKTQIGEWHGTSFVVDNSAQLAGLSDEVLSCVEMVTPPFDEPPYDKQFKGLKDVVQYVGVLAQIAESMYARVGMAHDAARRGVYNDRQPDAAVRNMEEEAIRDIPTLVPDDDGVRDMLTRHEMVYPDFRLGLLSTNPDSDMTRVTPNASVQATVGIDLEHMEKLFALAGQRELIQGYAGKDPTSGTRDVDRGISGKVAYVLSESAIHASNVGFRLEGAKPEAKHFYNLKGLLALLALYLTAGKLSGFGATLFKNFTPILSRAGLHDVRNYALSEKEKKFLEANLPLVTKLLLTETGRAADDRLVSDSTVALTCLHTILPILTGETDPVMAAIAEGEGVLSGSSMGTVLDVQNEGVGPVPTRTEKTPTPRHGTGRRLGVPVELRALAPNAASPFLPPREWEAFVARILKSVITINASSTANKEGCFLTTACVEARGLADDCAELTTLRAFRDGYMRAQPAGRAMIEEYYRIAPAIVCRMKASPRYRQEIAALYDRLVAPAVALVQAGRNAEALRLYAAEVRRLQARHLGGGRHAAMPARAVPPGCRMAAGELDRAPLHILGGAERLAAHAPTRRRRGRRGATEFLTESAKAPTVM